MARSLKYKSPLVLAAILFYASSSLARVVPLQTRQDSSPLPDSFEGTIPFELRYTSIVPPDLFAEDVLPDARAEDVPVEKRQLLPRNLNLKPRQNSYPNPPDPIVKCATSDELRYQPYMDFDTDSCYNVPAISPNGSIAIGISERTPATEGCRDPYDLDHSNVYSRKRCNNGWCAYMYTYYFEKDVTQSGTGGHRNDWEHVVVWVKDGAGRPGYVSFSAHGYFNTFAGSDVFYKDGDHVLTVYHRNDPSTHTMREARPPDLAQQENAFGRWIVGDLISWTGWEIRGIAIRNRLTSANFGSASIGINDTNFVTQLGRAKPDFPEKFDTSLDQAQYVIPTEGSNDCPRTTPTQPPPQTGLPKNLKVMIVGDSITQGAEGDWTWRYRIYQWFKNQASDFTVDFVGPYTGTIPAAQPGELEPPQVPGEPTRTSTATPTVGLYARDTGNNWDSNHFSTWGRQVAQTKSQIYDQVRQYQPDLLLVSLGFNDVGWFVSGPQGTLDSMQTFVSEARRAKSNVKFVIGNIQRRTYIGGRDDLDPNTLQYNQMLRDAVPKWSTSESQIAYADIASEISCNPSACPAAYDGLHPRALGDFQIARAFSIALKNAYNVGNGPLVVPAIPRRPLPIPTNIQCAGVPYGVRCTWDAVFGSFGYDFRQRIKGQDAWTEGTAGANILHNTFTVDGVQWQYQFRSTGGSQGDKGDWSGIYDVTARRTTAPPPEGIRTRATSTGFNIEWAPVDAKWNADVYLIGFWDSTGGTVNSWLGGLGARGNQARITDLGPYAGKRFTIFMQTWNKDGPGLPAFAYPIVVNGERPPKPTNFEVHSVDATTMGATWTGSSSAAAYLSWIRNLRNNTDVSHRDGSVHEGTSFGAAFLFPGTWNYEFCVSAINGDLESEKTDCKVPPQPK